MKFAYADPPYIGCSKYYPEKQEINHKNLLQKLHDNYDGWALSSHQPGLWDLLPMIPKSWKCRIAVWCKKWTPGRISVYPQYKWEPIIFKSGRNKKRIEIKDWIITDVEQKGFKGSKPDEFCYWLFEILGMVPEDTFDDLFPGTGRVTRAWETWKKAGVLIFANN